MTRRPARPRRWASGTAAGGRCRTALSQIPAGHVTGLVGPNGAGKTTLLQPGRRPARPDRRDDRGLRRRARGRRRAARPGRLRRPGHPDLRGLTRRGPPAAGRAAQPALGRRRSPGAGSSGSASTRRRRPGQLSGGQRAQLALTLGLAKRPELLMLDEPVASLDPLARREFLQVLMEAVAERRASAWCCPRTWSPTSSGSATTSSCWSTPEVRRRGRGRGAARRPTTG